MLEVALGNQKAAWRVPTGKDGEVRRTGLAGNGRAHRRAGSGAVLAAAVSVSLIAAGGTALAAGGTAATRGSALARQAAASAVPWRQVGSGWVLAEFWPGKLGIEGGPVAAVPRLYLINPAGHRYLMHAWKSTKTPPYLIDWSGDKKRALLGTAGGYEQITLASGKVSRLSLPGSAEALSYTRPDGTNILGERPDGTKTRLVRYTLSGHQAKVLATGSDYYTAVYADNGATLAAPGSRSLMLLSNGGGVVRKLPVPDSGVGGCNPARWWNASTILAGCATKNGASSRLWLVPASGARSRALTPQRGSHSRDLGDIGAWRLPSGLYLQALGPCGTVQIFRQLASGAIKLVSIPGADGNNNRILTARGARLLVRAQTGCPGSESLLWFNPSTRHVQMLLKAPKNDAGVIGAIPYGEPVNLS
jgi:hypothetical protein